MSRKISTILVALVVTSAAAFVSSPSDASAQVVYRSTVPSYRSSAPVYRSYSSNRFVAPSNIYRSNSGSAYGYSQQGRVYSTTPQYYNNQPYSTGYRGTYNSPYRNYYPNNQYYNSNPYNNSYYGNQNFGTPSQQRGAVIGGAIGGAVGGQRGGNIGAAVGSAIGVQ